MGYEEYFGCNAGVDHDDIRGFLILLFLEVEIANVRHSLEIIVYARDLKVALIELKGKERNLFKKQAFVWRMGKVMFARI